MKEAIQKIIDNGRAFKGGKSFDDRPDQILKLISDALRSKEKNQDWTLFGKQAYINKGYNDCLSDIRKIINS